MRRETQAMLIKSLAISGLLGSVWSQGAVSQNPWGQASNQQLNSAGGQGSQSPFGNAGATYQQPVNQNPFGGNTGGQQQQQQQQQQPVNQNPFGGNTGGQQQQGGSINQNPFGGNTGGQQQQGGSTNQNPFGGNTGGQQPGGSTNQNPFGGNTGGQQQQGGSTNQNPFGGNTGGQQQPGGNTGGQQTPDGGSSGSQLPLGPLVDGRGCPPVRAQQPTPGSNSLVHANSPVCPTGDGQLYQSADGATFFIQCCSHGPGSHIDSFIAPDFRACMDRCSQTDTCHSVQYVAQPVGNEPYHECKLYASGDFTTSVCGMTDMHNYAFVIDPPVVDSPDLATIMCSRECPYADGQQFTSDAGEVFRIDCGARHGTRVIYQDTQETLEDCIQSCGNLMACHSVDYDTRRKTCYYGNHQGAPTIKAPSFGSAYSMGCSGACNKKSCCSGCGGKK